MSLGAGLSSEGFPASAQVREPKVDTIEPTGASRWILVALLAAAGSFALWFLFDGRG